MNKYIRFTILNQNKPLVIIEWETFEKLLKKIPKSVIIEEFAEDIEIERDWGKMSKKDIIEHLYLNYESCFPG